MPGRNISRLQPQQELRGELARVNGKDVGAGADGVADRREASRPADVAARVVGTGHSCHPQMGRFSPCRNSSRSVMQVSPARRPRLPQAAVRLELASVAALPAKYVGGG
jgi:hypothetical protein